MRRMSELRRLIAEGHKIDIPERSDLPRVQGPWKEPRDNNEQNINDYVYAGPTTDGSQVPGPNVDEGSEKASPTRVAKKWSRLPKGWTNDSVKKFWGTMTSRFPKHPVKGCISKMEGKISEPGAFCGGLADEMIPGWRQESAKERRKKKEKKD